MTQTELSSRYVQIMRRIAAAAGPRKVTLLAVSKGQTVEAILALYHLGHRDFGENYMQELTRKARSLGPRCPGIRWHFIGHLQTNKVKALIPYVHAVHSVDSVKLATELSKRWQAAGRAGKLPVFLEVNVANEPSKSGVHPDDAPAISRQLAELPALELRGLMCIPEASADEARLRAEFLKLRDLEAGCRPQTHGDLSMGMSADFELAIQCGSTHVRVGTALFGARPAKGTVPEEDGAPEEA